MYKTFKNKHKTYTSLVRSHNHELFIMAIVLIDIITTVIVCCFVNHQLPK